VTILEQAAPIAPESPIVTRTERVVRADDQLRLVIELLNLDVDLGTNTLVRVDPRQQFTGVRLTFGSQHTVEDTISTTDATPVDGVDHRTARDSRLVFELPEGTPYALSALLDLAARAVQLDDRAVPERKSGNTEEPAAEVTALELVDSLVFSPDPDGRFTSAAEPITQNGVTELWRARLEIGDTRPNLYAIWSRPGDPPFTRPLPADQRELIVTATLTDEPLQVDRLWLTAQGSFLDVSGEWATGDLASYLHQTTAGRDLHVEVVERGYLAPFGVPATITTVTERAVDPAIDGVHDIAAHEVSFDSESGRWYADIELGPGFGYRPFLRMTLARFQPDSIGAALSSFVTLDPVRLGVVRQTSVTRTGNLVDVVVSGSKDLDNQIIATLEQADKTITDPDLRWQPVGKPVRLDRSQGGAKVTWKGALDLTGADPLRVVIEELEPGRRTEGRTVVPVETVVFVEVVELPPA
jgi:hypothetical protein